MITMHPVAIQLNRLGDELKATFFERDDLIDALILAVLAGEHVCAVGAPGTGKTLAIDYLMDAITGASKFEMILSKTRPAEKVIGPLDIKEYRENGNYLIKRRGFATACELIKLDEIGKMSPVLGHDLLALLNERVYHEVDGELDEFGEEVSTHPAPLHTAFTASNEIPINESDDAAAMWDRILVRVVVGYIKDMHNFAAMLTSQMNPPSTRVEFDELKKVTEVEVPAIALSDEAVAAMVALHIKMNAEQLVVSDRRWHASVKLLKAAAFLAGADRVTEEHLIVLKYTLWDDLDQVARVTELCESASNPAFAVVREQGQHLVEIEQGLASRAGDPAALSEYGTEVAIKLAQVRKNLDQLLMSGRAVPGFAALADKHHDLLVEMYQTCRGEEPAAARSDAAKHLGLGTGVR